MATTNLRLTFGAMFIGCLISISLSGIGTLQTYHYFRQYKKRDSLAIKLMVMAVWFMDFIHSIFICQGMWYYLVINWGNVDELDHLIWTVAASIAATGFITFTVQVFFVHRVWRLSKRNALLSFTILLAAFVRLGSSLATTVEMLRLERFSLFIVQFRWLFTFGLALTCAIDIMLTSSLCYYLQISRTGYSSMDEVIHRLLMYTISNGILTTFVSLLAMIFAIALPRNFLFLSLHFVIAKCYVNSLVATLNSRDAIKRRDDSLPLAIHVSVDGHSQPRFRHYPSSPDSPTRANARGELNVFGRPGPGPGFASGGVDESQAPSVSVLVDEVKKVHVDVTVEHTIHRDDEDTDGELELGLGLDRSFKFKALNLTPVEDDKSKRTTRPFA